MTLHLAGSGVNPHWNVHRSLEMLQGLQSTAMLLIREMDKHITQRDSVGERRSDMLGNAVAAVVLTSYTTEVALKTTHALNHPERTPPSGHNLLNLYDALDEGTQSNAQELLHTLSPLGAPEWIGENPNIRELIELGATNFSDWRYLPEQTSVDGGVPKVLVNVVNVLRALCLQRVCSTGDYSVSS